MRLRWSPKSPYARKVMMVAYEHGLESQIERVRTLVPADDLNHGLMSVNPLHKLPTLELADGTALYDSCVISEYLDSIGSGPSLFGAEQTHRWDVLRRQALGNGFIDLLIAWRLEIVKEPAMQSAVYLAAYAVKTRYVLARLNEDALKFDARMDIGQLATACAISYLDYRFADNPWRREYPPLAGWYEQMQRRRCLIETPID